MPRVKFLSTSPAWGTTSYGSIRKQSCEISIHVPRVGDDADGAVPCAVKYISIHVPRVGDDRAVFL